MAPLLRKAPRCIIILLVTTVAVFATRPAPAAEDATATVTSEPRLPAVDAIVQRGLDAGEMPGAIVLIGQGDRVLHRAAYGFRQVEPEREPMTLQTLFDLASLTKPVATAASIMLLAERDQLDVLAPVARRIPEFAASGKDSVTVHQLLTHTSGLIADNALKDYRPGRKHAFDQICRLNLTAPPGERFIYSDVGYITLGFLVERVSGMGLDEFTRKNFFEPLKMSDTCFCPAPAAHGNCAPADRRGEDWIRGTVHDPRAFALGGVAGHAGLFSTADDLARYARMILHRGELDGVRVLRRESVELMLISRPVPENGIRTWGWDRQTRYSSNRGDGMSERAIGHGGFTGTGLWIDPDLELYVIFLSNRLHPNGTGKVNPLIGEIGTAAVNAVNVNAPQ